MVSKNTSSQSDSQQSQGSNNSSHMSDSDPSRPTSQLENYPSRPMSHTENYPSRPMSQADTQFGQTQFGQTQMTQAFSQFRGSNMSNRIRAFALITLGIVKIFKDAPLQHFKN